MQNLGSMSGGYDSHGRAVSGNGEVVVGEVLDASFAFNAFRWTQAEGMQSLGSLNGGRNSWAYGASADGSVIVGGADNGAIVSGNDRQAFRWTREVGMQSLGEFSNSTAYGVSADGSVIVGVADDPAADPGYSQARAFRWTQNTGLVSLGNLNSDIPTISTATAVSADGNVIVGWAFNDSDSYKAFRWTAALGMQGLGTLSGGSRSWAYGVNRDGSVVVGQADSDVAASRAIRWTQATGMQTVEDWLRGKGLTIREDMTFAAYGVNADGATVVGQLDNLHGAHAFIARVSTAGSGLVTLDDVAQSLRIADMSGGIALRSAGLMLNGAHSRPLDRRVGQGQMAFWVAGDWGRDDRGVRNGPFGLAEVGGVYHMTSLQVNVAVGQTWANQDMVLNGRVSTDGTYVIAEALLPLVSDMGGGFWTTLGMYYQRGDANIRRGYLNAGTSDFSRGKPDTDTWGLRARLDWEKAGRLGQADFSPYADLSYARANLDAYTEIGGGFPAQFNARHENITELRLGINARYPLNSSSVRLIGMLEAAHRFEKHGARTSGQMIGLFPFDLDGLSYRQNWLRAGAGVEGRIGQGLATLMLNGTTHGEMPSAWLMASYQLAF
jgi:probable HAF family extracellular repeat protein